MSELQVPTLRRSQRLSVSQANSRSSTPAARAAPPPKRSIAKTTKTAVSRVAKPTSKSSTSKTSSAAKLSTPTTRLPSPPPATLPTPTIPNPPPPRKPRVDRIYLPNHWSSTPASLSFITHGALPTTATTTTLTLNILDYTIQPANWNPAFSANKLSASCFFFASVLAGNAVSAAQVARSAGWCHRGYAEALARGGDVQGVLRVLDVSRTEVVRGYGILLGMREGLRGVVGEFEGALEGMPSEEEVMGCEEKEREEGENHAKEVRERMLGLGFVSGKMFEVEGEDKESLEEEVGPQSVEEKREKYDTTPTVLIDVELEDFEDFVAENE